ncbi:MAG: family 78 glycoside hydrolase catalytic domain, partial [Clostridia bacterium]|nr:family 78 glycoside hydrolase catalytic domain [Clostridia bacterium]
ADFSKLAWDSTKIDSNRTFEVVYKGDELKKDTKYFYQVTCGINNKEYVSETAYFITGTLGEPIDARWITAQQYDYQEAETCPMIRKSFEVDTKDMEYATIQLHCFGLYELYINGKRPDDRLMAPSFSDNNAIIKYDVYEITDLIKQGKNAVGLFIGDGYNDTWNINWVGKKRMIASVNIHYKDGTVKRIITDNSWRCNYNSPIVVNSIYHGEVYDATKEIDGWNTAEFDDSSWENTYYAEGVINVRWKGWIGPRVRVTKYLEPKKIYSLKNGRYIIDFGQNTAGVVKINLSGKKGTSIRMRFSEELTNYDCAVASVTGASKETRLDTFTNRAARATDTYIFKGDGVETYQPHFTYHGFRYVEITGLTHKPCKGEIVSCAMSADFDGLSSFVTDNKLLNRIHENALWSFRSNNFTFPADCPQRDERVTCAFDFYNGHAIGLYLYDICAFCENWLDVTLEKQENVNDDISMAYYAILITLCWNLYLTYGDSGYIRDNYKTLKKYMENRYLKYYPELYGRDTFGDWCAPHIPGDFETSYSSVRETETHSAINAVEALANMAELLGKKSDAKRYRDIAQKGREQYNRHFYDSAAKRYSYGKQAPNIFALTNDYVPQYDRKTVEKNLLNAITVNGNRLDVGTFGARLFIECLSDIGAVDTALDCFTKDEFPSFKYQIDHGATTIWEQWYEKGNMDSHNHQMFGGAMTGFYSRLAGITAIEPGYRVIGIKPVITRYINELKTTVNTACGAVDVQYVKKDNAFTLTVNIPANCTAIVTMPDGETHNISNGKFNFECSI